MWRLGLAMLVICGCASAPSGPFFGDERYLRFGVDPNQEANAVIESQKARSFPLALRLLGRNFTALGFMDTRGRSAAVRILTRRGIVVALDSRARSPLEPGVSYALIEPPIEDTHDADGDGFEEVFVEQRGDRMCLSVYRVRDVGFVDPVELDATIMGEAFCPSSAVDLDGDGRIELLGELTLTGFAVGAPNLAPPHLQLPLWAVDHRFSARAGTRPQQAWLAAERSRRQAELLEARQRIDAARSFTLAVELAALAHLEGADAAGQVTAYDRALAGFVLTPTQAATSASARARIYADWNAPRAELEPDDATATAAVQAGPKPTATNGGRAKPPAPPARARAEPKPTTPSSSERASKAESDRLREQLLQQLKNGAAREPASSTAPPRHGVSLRRFGEPKRPEPVAQTKPSQPARAPASQPRPQARPPRAAATAEGGNRVYRAEPALAPGEFVIEYTPKPRRQRPAARPQPAQRPAAAPARAQPTASPTTPRPTTTMTPEQFAAYRAKARELGNTAAAARKAAAAERKAAGLERQRAQRARLAAAQASDPEDAAAKRAVVAQHVEAAQRHAEAAARLADEAAEHRDQLASHRATLSDDEPPAH